LTSKNEELQTKYDDLLETDKGVIQKKHDDLLSKYQKVLTANHDVIRGVEIERLTAEVDNLKVSCQNLEAEKSALNSELDSLKIQHNEQMKTMSKELNSRWKNPLIWVGFLFVILLCLSYLRGIFTISSQKKSKKR